MHWHLQTYLADGLSGDDALLVFLANTSDTNYQDWSVTMAKGVSDGLA